MIRCWGCNASAYLGKSPAVVLPPQVPGHYQVTELENLCSLWYLYNIEPVAAWKMFRTASMLWQTYNLKHRDGIEPRTVQEESESFCTLLYLSLD
jgi:hypothetical protein